MHRKLFLILAFLLFLVVHGPTPVSVQAEGGPQPTPEPVKPPWITGQNTNVLSSEGKVGELIPAGVIERWEGIEVPFLSDPPKYVEVAPLNEEENTPSFQTLAVPQRYQDPSDVNCGAAALGMALDFLSLSGEGEAPSAKILVADLKNSGLLYETGTGVEELAYLARGHGYRGTTAFHNWTLEQIAEQIRLGKPVVVSLGVNGENQPGHFVTVTGVSEDGEWVRYNDPILGAQTVPVHDFLKAWSLQGNSGLVVQKQPHSMANDPMLPWMGLFGALTTLAVLVRSDPSRKDLGKILAVLRGVLSNPRRKGFGGRLLHDGSSGNSSSPPYTAPAGYKWKKTYVPKYGWKDVEIIEKVEVPNLVRTRAVVRVNRWMEKVPVYKTVKVDRGHWAYRTVTKYRTERYRTRQRYRVKKTYWYRRGYRLYRGTRYEWKTRTVVKTRRVPYTKRERYWVPKIVTERRIDRYREIEHRDPVYGWRMEKRGTKIVGQKKTTRAWKPVGSEVKWELKRDPKPLPTSTPSPIPIPTPAIIPTPSPTLPITPIPFSNSYPESVSVSSPTIWEKFRRRISDGAVSLVNAFNQKVKEPVQNTVLNPVWWQEQVVEASKTSQPVLSLSASNEWDFNLFSQEGVIAQSYVPPNILKMLYVGQEFNIKPKAKVTANPGSILDIDITSGTYKVNLGEKLSIFSSIKGGGITVGVGIKRSDTHSPHDYLVDKHSLSSTWRGITHTYRQEGTNIDKKVSNEDLEVKKISTLVCETQTIKTEGILIVVGAILGISELYALAVPVVEALPALPVIGTLLREALSGAQ